jgi:nitronate monooxygenase
MLTLSSPIIQAPMAGVQGSALAIAVSAARGLGSLPCAMLTPDDIRREVARIREHTDRPFNLNFFCHTMPPRDDAREAGWLRLLAPYHSELGIEPGNLPGSPRLPFDADALRVVAECRPAVVSFHFGLPSEDLLREVKAITSTVLSSATTIEEARWLEAHGADGIIAQGLEAGGHRGHFLSDDLTRQLGTFALLPQIVRAVSVPVIAAGGICDGAGVRAALALGAKAVQIGTAYLLCPEATTTTVHQSAISSTDGSHTALTNLFTGRPARGIVNRLMRDLGPLRPEAPAFPWAASALAPLRAGAEAQGRGDFSPLWAGQNVSGCRRVSAGELTRELAG